MDAAPRIIIDWGTTNFRAYRFDVAGGLVASHAAPAGILSVTDGAFEAALMREIGGWIGPDTELLLSGMITSRNGWRETPYAEAPATLADLKRNARVERLAGGARLMFLPGVAMRAPLPDVMRGEEIQVFGTVDGGESATVILPGTHSKWVRAERDTLAAFRTFFTGEMFALLKAHSIIGKLVPEGATPAPDAFLAGVRQAQSEASAGVLSDIFTARAGALLGAHPAGDIPERLSGLLIGHEIRAGLALGWPNAPLYLVGDPTLCARYRTALGLFGLECRMGPELATVEGFRKLASVSV